MENEKPIFTSEGKTSKDMKGMYFLSSFALVFALGFFCGVFLAVDTNTPAKFISALVLLLVLVSATIFSLLKFDYYSRQSRT